MWNPTFNQFSDKFGNFFDTAIGSGYCLFTHRKKDFREKVDKRKSYIDDNGPTISFCGLLWIL